MSAAPTTTPGTLLPRPCPEASPAHGRRVSRGVLWMLLASVLFAVMGALGKVGLDQVPVAEAVFARSGVGLLFLLALQRVRRRPLRGFVGQRHGPLLLRGLFGSAALLALFHMIQTLTLAEATVIIQSSAVFVVLIAWLFLKERLSGGQLALIALALAGMVVVVQPGWSGASLAAALGVGGAVCSAAAYVMIRHLTATEHNTTILFYFLCVSVLTALPLFLPVAVVPGPGEAAALVGSGLASALGQLAMNEAYRQEQAGAVAATGTAGVLCAALIGAVGWGEVPSPTKLAGGLVLLLALAGLALHGGRRTTLRAGTTPPSAPLSGAPLPGYCPGGSRMPAARGPMPEGGDE
ncbi:MAG: DMT family transporter [Myxococcota bacterium]|nr:DMT family transporter [Myxococcota bacterium]